MKRFGLAGALGLLLSAHVFALDSMRCGNRLVAVGDTKVKVLRLCGEPDHRERVSGEEAVPVEQWIYGFGSRRFPRVLTFEGTGLSHIEVMPE